MNDLLRMTAVLRLVVKPDIRWSEKGNAWATFRGVATTRKRGDGGGWVDDNSTFLTVKVLDNHLAANLAESDLVPGDTVVVTGRLEQREFERTDGTKGTATEVIADELAVSLRWRAVNVLRTATVSAAPSGGFPNPQAPQAEEPPF